MAVRSSFGIAAAAAAAIVLLAVTASAAATNSAVNGTGQWDAYPGPILSMCPHVPRGPINFDKLNGRWYVMEKGGMARPEILCEMDFHVAREQNLTLNISLRAFEDQDLRNQFNSTWTMSDDNVWREDGDTKMFMFVGLSTARSLLLVCAVDDPYDTHDGYSLSLTREPNYVRNSELRNARLPGDVEPIDRTHCPSA